MNLSTVNIMILLGGVILIYGAVKNRDPRGIIQEAMGREDTFTIKGFARPLNPTDKPPIGGGGGVPSFTGQPIIDLPIVTIPSV